MCCRTYNTRRCRCVRGWPVRLKQPPGKTETTGIGPVTWACTAGNMDRVSWFLACDWLQSRWYDRAGQTRTGIILRVPVQFSIFNLFTPSSVSFFHRLPYKLTSSYRIKKKLMKYLSIYYIIKTMF
jgi:hypothetical protein